MKKLTISRRGYHDFLLLPLTLFTFAFSFCQTIITGTASDDNNNIVVSMDRASLNELNAAAGNGQFGREAKLNNISI